MAEKHQMRSNSWYVERFMIAQRLSFVEQNRNKAEYLASVYGQRTNRNIRGHPIAISKDDLTLLRDKTIVFVAIDNPCSKNRTYRTPQPIYEKRCLDSFSKVIGER